MVIKKNIPQLRFPEFEGEYEKRILNDTCTIVGGGTPDSGKEELWNGHIQWFTPTEIKMDYVSKSERTITELGLKKSSARILPKGTILLTSRATIGEVAIALNECTTNQGFQSLIVNKLYNNLFIFNWIKNNRYQFVRRANGSTFLEISKSEIGKIPICTPTLPEQQKIASFFTAIDQKISQLKRKLILLEQYKKGLMQKIFTQQIRFKDDNGQEFPKWEKKKLGDCLDYIQPTKYIVNTTEYDNSYQIPVLTAGKSFILGYTDETEGIYNDCLPVIIFDDFTTSSQFVDFAFKVKSSAMKILVAKLNVNIKYIFEAMQTLNYEIGGHERHWISKFSPMCIDLPSLPEQTKIASFLSTIDDKITHTQKQIEKAEVWKKGLMQQMFV